MARGAACAAAARLARGARARVDAGRERVHPLPGGRVLSVRCRVLRLHGRLAPAGDDGRERRADGVRLRCRRLPCAGRAGRPAVHRLHVRRARPCRLRDPSGAVRQPRHVLRAEPARQSPAGRPSRRRGGVLRLERERCARGGTRRPGGPHGRLQVDSRASPPRGARRGGRHESALVRRLRPAAERRLGRRPAGARRRDVRPRRERAGRGGHEPGGPGDGADVPAGGPPRVRDALRRHVRLLRLGRRGEPRAGGLPGRRARVHVRRRRAADIGLQRRRRRSRT